MLNNNVKTKLIEFVKSPDFIFAILASIVFVVVYPLSSKIHFYQNDDWVYYEGVQKFLNGNFDIKGYIEATFYTQGLLGASFAYFFGLSKLPILTLLFSVANFYLLALISYKFYTKKYLISFLLAAMLFVNPLHSYATLGFMTDVYSIFFMLLTFYFAELYLQKGNKSSFVLSNLSMLAGFFVRQLSIITSVALAIQFALLKRKKDAITQAIIIIFALIYYFFIHPKTYNMVANQEFNYLNLLNLQKTFSITFIGLLYATMFSIPLVLFLLAKVTEGKKLKLLFVLLLSGLFVILINMFFVPVNSRRIAPLYLTNTVETNGFFYGSTLGNKYKIQNEKIIFKYFAQVAQISLCIILGSLIIIRKRTINQYTVYMVLYLGVMAIMLTVYDRYYLPLVPVAILAVLHINPRINRYFALLIFALILPVSFLTYNFSMEFVLLNNKLWAGANELVNKGLAARDQISAGYAWRRTYDNATLRYKYVYYFEPRENNPDLKCCFSQLKIEDISFPYSIFDNAKIYLLKRKF